MKRRRCICNDCGVDIVKAGEYVMLDLQIWVHELGLDLHDNLCIGCVEKRLGRRIKGFGDITNMQNCGPMSLRLQVRVFGRAITKRKPYRLKAGSNIHGMTAKDLAVTGKARDAGL